MALSDTWLKNQLNKPIATRTEKADRDGLSVRVSTKGKITFQMRFRLAGRKNPDRIDLGTYPELSLAQARAQCTKYRADLQLGNDPRVTRRMELTAVGEALTLSSLFYTWHEKYCLVRKKRHEAIKRQFELHLLPELGHLPAETITLHEWLDEFERLAQEYSTTSMSLLTNTKQMLKWAVKRKLITANALSQITASEDLHLNKGMRNRSLSDQEIVWLYDAIHHSRLAPKNALLFEFCLLTGCRVGELRQAKKSDFDFDRKIWTVPAENHKMGEKTGQPIIRPILPQWEPILLRWFAYSPGEYAIAKDNGKMLTQTFHTKLPIRLIQWLNRHRGVNMLSWSIHDLRRTARTNFSQLTGNQDIAEIALGHALPKIRRTYDQYKYLQEQTELYTAWWNRLQHILGRDVSNVVELKKISVM